MTMHTTIVRGLSALALATVIVTEIAHADTAAPVATVSATTQDIVRRNAHNVNLSTTGHVATTIVSVTLPPGSWILSATADVVNFGPSDYTRCGITTGGPWIGGVTTMVGKDGLPGSQGPGSYVSALANMATVTSAGTVTALLQCEHDTTTPSGYGPQYIDANAVLWAHKSPALDSATQ